MPGEFDMNHMQEEAIRRAREMQSRAHLPPRQNRRQGSRNEPAPVPVPEQPSEQKQPEPSHQEPAPPPNESAQPPAETEAPAPNGLLESLFQDKERTIILALLILLSGEESSHELMFALMFLLM